MKALAAAGEKGLVELIAATHAGMSTAEFEQIVSDWIATARHPRFKRPYTELVYQPMLELLAYLRANGFKTFIVSGGGIEFMRPWTEKVYGIPPEQVVGSSIVTQVRDARRQAGADAAGRGRLRRRRPRQAGRHQPASSAAGRSSPSATPTAICRCCSGPRPADGARFGLIVHHTDAEREYAYDRDTIRQARQGARRRPRARLDRCGHERRLAGDLSRRTHGGRSALATIEQERNRARTRGVT